jgi:hypothetical protein
VFQIYCPAHGANVLLGLSRIQSVTNIDGLIVMELECDDGERLRHYSGRRFHESKQPSRSSS